MLTLHTSIPGKKHKVACCICILSFVPTGPLPHWSIEKRKSMRKCRITKRDFNGLKRAELHPFITSLLSVSVAMVCYPASGLVSGNCPRKNCPDEGQKQPTLCAIINLAEVKGALFLFLNTNFCSICTHITYHLGQIHCPCQELGLRLVLNSD